MTDIEMIKHIVWSPLSENDISDILNYLGSNWNQKVANHFIAVTENILHQLAVNPKQFPFINKKERIR